MGIPVMILGESGSGKTYSIKNMDPDQVGVFLCEKSRLPFRGSRFKTYQVRNRKLENGEILRQGGVIQALLKKPKLRCYVVDDSQYIMSNEFFDRATEKGYDKFTEIGKNFRDLIHFVNNNLPDDVIVYFLHHPESDSTTGRIKAKTIGKMLDSVLTLEGCFDIILKAETNGMEHWFTYQSNGLDTVKSPEDMFSSEDGRLPNDLAAVDTAIRRYYDMDPIASSAPPGPAEAGAGAADSEAW